MKVTGTATLAAEPTRVWQALNDPGVLVRAIPGCVRLQALGDDAFAMTVAAGVGSVKGVYDGQVRLLDLQEPGSFRMRAEGTGAAGTIGADVQVRLEDAPGGGTALSYDADAVVGGTIGGVGQRMLTGVSRRMAQEFFANVEAALASPPWPGLPDGGGAPEPSGASRLPPGPSTVAPPPSVRPAPYAAGEVFTPPRKTSGEGRTLLTGVVLGAAAALAGAVVGGWIAGRRMGR